MAKEQKVVDPIEEARKEFERAADTTRTKPQEQSEPDDGE